MNRKLVEPDEAAHRDDLRSRIATAKGEEFLKAHMRDGRLFVLSDWEIDADARRLQGHGLCYDAQRTVLSNGPQQASLDSVAIFETNSTRPSGAIASMTIVTGASLVATFVCLTNPKACFGSCPTFYIEGDPDSLLQAEGFSFSVAPSLEATDLDALHRARVSGTAVELRMVNEALETHVVRHADLLVAPRPAGGHVLATPGGRLRASGPLLAPIAGRGPEGDCLDALARADGRERISETDSSDLARKEVIELAFHPVPAGDLGLVVTARQSLLTTFLFYHLLACMGSHLGEYMARLESGASGVNGQIRSFGPHLGAIEAQVLTQGGWITIGSAGEAGPLATDRQVIPFACSANDTLRVRLEMTRGAWRLDQVALAALNEEVTPERLRPCAVTDIYGPNADALAALLDSTRVIVTSPGDVYRLRYERSAGFDGCELFLESRGYYLEWMRQEWLAEENPALAMTLLLAPDAALRTLAPEYKRVEAQMDAIFWRSRYAR